MMMTNHSINNLPHGSLIEIVFATKLRILTGLSLTNIIMENTYTNENGLLKETQPIPPAPVLYYSTPQIDDNIDRYTQSIADDQANLAIWQTLKAKAIELGVTE